MKKVKSIKILSWFFAIAIAICLIIILVSRLSNQSDKQSAMENNIAMRIVNIYKDVSLTNMNVSEKYLSNNLYALTDKAFSLADGPDYIDYNIWTNSQDFETVTADILYIDFISETQAIVRIQVNDSCFGSLNSPILFFQYENGDWFVDDIINDEEGSLKIYTIKFIDETN